MKKSLVVVALIGIMLAGCQDGKDGDAFLAFFWVAPPVSYSDNNPSIPPTIILQEQYSVEPGTYGFTYTAWDNSVWSGTYTITIEEGIIGLFPLVPGPDGEDSHFELWLFSIGPSFWDVSETDEISLVVQRNATTSGKSIQVTKHDYIGPIPPAPTDYMESVQVSGRYKFVVKAWRETD
ncbi:MAG: hypothetical protein OEZ10_04530 [Gammaproteobacteria bacterium]|nr:hypothetical protein [Gammaproteobacteria bacterium]